MAQQKKKCLRKGAKISILVKYHDQDLYLVPFLMYHLIIGLEIVLLLEETPRLSIRSSKDLWSLSSMSPSKALMVWTKRFMPFPGGSKS